MASNELPFEDERISFLFKRIKGGLFTLPSHLSHESEDLIINLLVVDPMKRINIDTIRQDPWFRKDLPYYLNRMPTVGLPVVHIDQDLVSRVAKLTRLNRSWIARALESGRCSKLTAGYRLEKDTEEVTEIPGEQYNLAEETSRNDSVHTNEEASDTLLGDVESHSGQSGESELSDGTKKVELCNGKSWAAELASRTKKAHTREWTCGLRCTAVSAEAGVKEVFRALKVLGCGLKTEASRPYRVCVLCDKTRSNRQLRLAVQFFKSRTEDCIYLDFHRLRGDTVDFFNFCTELTGDLKL